MLLGGGGFWDDAQVSGPPDFDFDSSKRFHFLDEIHELKDPEPLYPLLDTGDYTIIIATNEVGLIKDPLANRCIHQFIFRTYTRDELYFIAQNFFAKRGVFNLPPEFIWFCVDRCAGVPRQLRNIVFRLAVLFRTSMPNNIDELNEIVTNILNISAEGLDAGEQMYLDFLRSNGRSSLSLISAATGLTKETITRFIEPHLIKEHLISIGSRGREPL